MTATSGVSLLTSPPKCDHRATSVSSAAKENRPFDNWARSDLNSHDDFSEQDGRPIGFTKEAKDQMHGGGKNQINGRNLVMSPYRLKATRPY